ncbi:hypothetical protein [Pedobacter sp. JY14-1]|uniref:hypothetical protein n=1 Tax=Pedobacter sp. JY14-1 TaxID=3034151 RepID=UPI0023E18C50|nr:hypothetical protein [Pedobacter sp. JY14-1]
MNKKLTFGLVVAIVLLQACRKKDNSKEQKEKPHPVKLLTRVWGTDYYNQTRTVQREALFTYDDQNRLVKKIEEGGQTSTYTYKDGKLSVVEYLFGKNTTVKSISKYIYENGRVKGATETLYSSPELSAGHRLLILFMRIIRLSK